MKCRYCYWRNIIKHLFNVNTTSYNEKLFTVCCFQTGCRSIAWLPSVRLQPGSFSPVCSPCTRWLSRAPADSGHLSTYILPSNYGSAGMPPKSSITQRLWQSSMNKMRRLGFSPINTTFDNTIHFCLKKLFSARENIFFFPHGTRANSLVVHTGTVRMSLYTNIAYFGQEYNFLLKSLFALTCGIATYTYG